MYIVYVIHSPAFDKIYIGYTANLRQRLLAHNKFAKKGWTRRYRPWELITTELFNSKQEAMIREKQLKSARGRRAIRTLLQKRNN